MKGRLVKMLDRIKVLNKSSQSSIKREAIERGEEIFERYYLNFPELSKYSTIYNKHDTSKSRIH